jgi:cell division protein ZipA
VAPRGASTPGQRRQSPGLGNLSSVGAAKKTPPLVMEPEEPVKPPVTAAVQVDLFGEGQETVAETVVEQRAPAPAPAREPEPEPEQVSVREPDPDLLEVIVMHMVTSAANAMPGRDLLQALLEQGMRYGDMNIFHRHQSRNGRDELQFSMANALEPGTFDIDAMEGHSFRAVTFFLKMPGPANPAEALERMVRTVRHLAEQFGGEVRDDQHCALTQQTVEHMRERVRDFERRQRVAGG